MCECERMVRRFQIEAIIICWWFDDCCYFLASAYPGACHRWKMPDVVIDSKNMLENLQKASNIRFQSLVLSAWLMRDFPD